MITMRPATCDAPTADDAPAPVTVHELDQFAALLDAAPAGEDPHDDPELVAMLAAIDGELRAHRVTRR